MDLKQLTELYQILSTIKTEGQNTVLMANCLILLNNGILNISNATNSEAIAVDSDKNK